MWKVVDSNPKYQSLSKNVSGRCVLGTRYEVITLKHKWIGYHVLHGSLSSYDVGL